MLIVSSMVSLGIALGLISGVIFVLILNYRQLKTKIKALYGFLGWWSTSNAGIIVVYYMFEPRLGATVLLSASFTISAVAIVYWPQRPK